MENELKEIVYIEHIAGVFEDGLQCCKRCGHIITDYTGNWMSPDPSPSFYGWPEGFIYTTGKNPIQTMTEKPKENYGGNDPYKRTVKSCIEK